MDAKQPFPTEAIRQRLQDRLQALPVHDSVRLTLERELGTLMEQKTLQTGLQDLLSGRIGLDESLLAITTRATEVIETVLREEQRRMIMETRTDMQVQAGLLQSQGQEAPEPVPPQRGPYVLQGQVRHGQSQEPLAGVVVQAVTRKGNDAAICGLAVTDPAGRYLIKLRSSSVLDAGEDGAELMVQVGPDRLSAVHATDQPIRVKPHQPVTADIQVPQPQADVLQQAIASDSSPTLNRLQNLQLKMAQNQLHHLQVQAMGQAFSQQLEQVRQRLTSGNDSGAAATDEDSGSVQQESSR